MIYSKFFAILSSEHRKSCKPQRKRGPICPIPIVEKYKEYKAEKQNIEDSLMLLEEESDEEMKELAKEELNESKANVERLEEELKILLIPKDPMDDKNIIVEMRAGAGGDEAGL